jgi:hypothetical protein
MALNVHQLLLKTVAAVVLVAAVTTSAVTYLDVRNSPQRPVVSMKCARHEDGATESGTPCIIWQPSLMQLMARPEFYDGKLVEVVGFVHFEFEGDGLSLHREDNEQHRHQNAIGLSPDYRISDGRIVIVGIDADACQDTYALVRGRFDAHGFGHKGMSRGGIYEVSMCEAIVALP